MIAATDAGARRLVVEALDEARVAAAGRDPRIAGYLAGLDDLHIDDLRMDSLDVMEFCIAIELSAGVSIVPDDLRRLGTLANVADAIRKRLA